MNTFELNKIAAGILTTLLVLYVVNMIGNIVISPKDLEMVAYPLPQVEDTVLTEEAEEAEEVEVLSLASLLIDADIKKGQKVAKKCAACHTFGQGEKNKVGPNLWNIVGRDMASMDGFSYSSALSGFNGKWNYKSLNQFLTKPKEYIPGNKMSFRGLSKETDRANLIIYLRSMSESPLPLPEG